MDKFWDIRSAPRNRKKEQTGDQIKVYEFTTPVPPSENQQIRPVQEVPRSVHPSPHKEKVADIPYSKPSMLIKIIDFIIPRSSGRATDHPQRQDAVSLLELMENKQRTIEDLRIQIGSDEDNATLVIVELLHRKRDKVTEVELYLNVQAPISRENAGRVKQATIHIKFLDPGGRCFCNSVSDPAPDASPENRLPIYVDEFVSIDEQPAPKVANVTENKERSWNVGGKIAEKPELTGELGGKTSLQTVIERVPFVSPKGIRDIDEGIRWILEEDPQVSSARLNHHGLRHRIDRHLPVMAHIRLSCECHKAKYVKPNGKGRLEILLKELSSEHEVDVRLA